MKLRHRLLVAMLLAPTLLSAQAASPAPKPASPAPAASGGSYPVMSTAARNRAKQLYGMFASSQTTQLFAAFSPDMKKGTSAAKLANTEKEVATQAGHESKILGENFVPDLLYKRTVYTRFSEFTKAKDPLYTVIMVNEQGQVAFMQFRPSPPPPAGHFDDYKATTKLRLPFTGEWFVYDGGRSVYQNSDAYRDTDRFSISFTVLKDSQAFSGDGTKNEQFYCFGQPVAAPADGTVVMVNGTYADNLPGRAEQVMPFGNRVMIYHGHQEYSLLLHLKQGSIKVKSGDQVKQGDVVAECGNSGNSPAPHLEYRLQNSKGRPSFPFTLPAEFTDYVADGKPETSGEPVRGQFVRNGTETAAPPPGGKVEHPSDQLRQGTTSVVPLGAVFLVMLRGL